MAFRELTVADAAHAEPVSRRDFLRLRVSEGRRILELSCERLFMRYHDARSEAACRQVSNHEDVPGAADALPGFAAPSVEALFAELEQRLATADELRVQEPEWLGDDAFAREIAARIEAFGERGGAIVTDRPAQAAARTA